MPMKTINNKTVMSQDEIEEVIDNEYVQGSNVAVFIHGESVLSGPQLKTDLESKVWHVSTRGHTYIYVEEGPKEGLWTYKRPKKGHLKMWVKVTDIGSDTTEMERLKTREKDVSGRAGVIIPGFVQ